MFFNCLAGKTIRSSVAMVLLMLLLISSCFTVFADTADDVNDTAAGESSETAPLFGSDGDSSYIKGFSRTNQYSSYYDKYKEYDIKLDDIIIDPSTPSLLTAPASREAEFEGKTNVLKVEGTGDIVYTFDVPETGMYALEFLYYPMVDRISRDIEVSLFIDNVAPFDTCEAMILKRNWADETDEPIFDSVNNQLLPAQVQKPAWLKKDFQEPNGNYMDSVRFYLSQGTHQIKITSKSGTYVLAQIRFHNDGALPTYDEYKAEYDAKGATDVGGSDSIIAQEAEKYVDKSDSIIQAAYDRSDPKVTPYHVSRTRLNTLGGTNWNTSQQIVNWTIEVPESGYYTLDFKFRQSFVRGATVYRRIYIDGKVPFTEAETIGFRYGIGYQVMTAGRTVGKTFEPYRFYFEKGTHTFSMEAVIGDMAKSSRDVEDVVYQLNYIYRKIIMVTSANPDLYRDYRLESSVSGFKEMLESASVSLGEIKETIDTVSSGAGGASEILTTLKVQVDSFINMPYTVPERLSAFKDNISSLGSWMLDIRDQPVQIDKFVFSGADVKTERLKANFLEKITHEVSAFFSSFIDDYTSIGNTSNDDRALTVWVGTGRDQAIVLKTLVDNYFTPQTNISVNVSLVPLGVLSKAIIAGRGPDIALSVSRTEPMNLGIRSALVELQDFPDFEEVLERFQENAEIPYTLNTTSDTGEDVYKVFALPETQNFHMMFYRIDVFDELGIKPPETWEEFEQILPYIQQNNMTVGLDSHLSETSPTPGGLFYTLIQQKGYHVYNELGSGTNFREEYAVEAFNKWTSYYTLYDFPLSYSAYTRFRNGEMPLIVTSYSQITYFSESAPELRGLWGVAPIPGTPDEKTGIVNKTEESRGVSACMIVKNKANSAEKEEQKKNDAWEFLKWWTSTDIQAEYGNRIEMAIGPVARWTTANQEAFELLNWTSEESATIKEQWKWVNELPELVGGYYVGRTIVNAFRNVTNNHTNAREMLFYYNDQIDAEIWRKRIEYNLSVPEEAKK